MPTLLGVVLSALLAAFGTTVYFVWSRRRHTAHLELDIDRLPPLDQSLALLAGMTGAGIYEGNRARLVYDGALFDEVERDIRTARHTVHIETFVWSAGALEARMVALLCAAAARGVEVRLIIDAIGGNRASPAALRQLHAGGVELVVYRPPHRLNIRRLNHRTHRKLLIVDGAIGYIFGHGFADQWLGGAQDHAHWRDTGVRLEGPVVHGLQTIFFQHWTEETHAIPAGPGIFPPLEPLGTVEAHVVRSDAGEAVSSVATLYILALASARREIIIQNPYFVPGSGVVKLLKEMVRRGVAVHLMVPGRNTDSPFVRRAGCYLYEGLMRAGVRLYEYEPTLAHQKVVIVDGIWSHIGSTNFDARSLALNEEAGVGLRDAAVATELRRSFERDLQSSREMDPDRWRQRGRWRRAYEWFAYQLHEQL
ncbi:MAG TPA: phospholipase D-like domain-containing protein [Nevskiaceae bacterium]|nr:phospholipase D-like domain-containing protein [Nevskiaceae bacterium]